MNRGITFCLLVIFILLLTTPVWAATNIANPANIIAYQESLVPEGQTVNSVLLIGKDGVIAGTVNDEVIVIRGSVTIKSTARVFDRVFVIGGDIKQEPGAKVGKGVFNISTSNATTNSLILGFVTFLGIEIVKLIVSICAIFAVLIVVIIAPNIAEKSADKLRGGTLKSAVLGILALISFSLLIAALVSSVWGIPLALLIILLMLILLVIGFTGMGLVFGDIFRKGANLTAQSKLIMTCIGSLMLVTMLNLPIVGVLWGLVVIILALGSTVQLLFRKGSKGNQAE